MAARGLGLTHARLLSQLSAVTQLDSVVVECMLQICVTQALKSLGSRSLFRVCVLSLTGKLQKVLPRQRHLKGGAVIGQRGLPCLEVEVSLPYDVFEQTQVTISPACRMRVDHFGGQSVGRKSWRVESRCRRIGIGFSCFALCWLCLSCVLGGAFDVLGPKQLPRDGTLGFPGEGPVRIRVKLGELTLHAMVDSGSDYNAINADLAVLQERANNPAFGGRRDVQPESIGGYAEGLNKVVSQASRWTVTLTGFHDDDTFCTKPVEHSVAEEFHEVLGLNDPIILGNPWLGKYGPLIIEKDALFLNNIWMDRTDRVPDRDRDPRELRLCRMASCPSRLIDDKGWYPVDVQVDDFHDLAHALQHGSVWVEGSGLYDNLMVLESRLSQERGDSSPDPTAEPSNQTFPTTDDVSITSKDASAACHGRITVLVTALPGQVVRLQPSKPIAALRWEDQADTDALASVAAVTCFSAAPAGVGQISTAKYKMRQKTDAQAKLFPQLLEEIENRRQHLEQVQPKDIHCEAYKAELMQICAQQNLVPTSLRDRFFQQIIRPFSDCFWVEGAPAPEIKGFKASIAPKRDAVFKAGQPYRLSRFDEARLSFLVEEEVVEGKLEPLGPNDPVPPMVTPTFVVDKKGSLIGRRVGDFRELNQNTEEYYYPAPDAEAILNRATGQQFHSTLDCVWGFSGLACDEDTSLLLSVITPAGVFKTKKLPFGPRQGPAIYQSVQERIFGSAFKTCGDPLVDIFVDDSHVGDADEESHFASLIQLLKLARQHGLQYRLSKCVFFQPECVLLGNIVGRHGRRPDPKKVSQLKEWPAPKSCADIMSFLAFANYLRMYLGPRFVDKSLPLRKYTRKGSDFQMYEHGVAAQKAFQEIRNTLVDRAVLYAPDWEAAAYPWRSARPFEVYIDASDHSYCAVLCGRPSPHAPPRPIAFFAKSFDEVATRWSAFEREFFAFREGMHALHKYVDGFPVYAFFDHHNVERAEAVLKSRRASKKLVAWIADAQPLLSNTMRVWIAGKDNILADSGSRAPWADAVARNLPVPEQSILETIDNFFTDPQGLAAKVETRCKTMGLNAWVPMDVNPVPEVWLPRSETPGKVSVHMPASSGVVGGCGLPSIPEQSAAPMDCVVGDLTSQSAGHGQGMNSTGNQYVDQDMMPNSLGSSSGDNPPQVASEHVPLDVDPSPVASDSSNFTRSRSHLSSHQSAAEVPHLPSAASSLYTRSRSRHDGHASEFELQSASSITPPRTGSRSDVWPASQIPSVSDITAPFQTPQSTSGSLELLPDTNMPNPHLPGSTPVLSESEASYSTSSITVMSSDTLLDAAAPSSNLAQHSTFGLLADELHVTSQDAQNQAMCFSAYVTFPGDQVGSANYSNMLLSLSNVGGKHQHHVWEIGNVTPCLSQACRAKRLKVMDPVMATDNHWFASKNMAWVQKQLTLNRPLLTWASWADLRVKSFVDDGFDDMLLSLMSFCECITNLGLYGCVRGLGKSKSASDWAWLLKDRRMVGWFLVEVCAEQGPWLTNCHVLAGRGRGSIHEHFHTESAKPKTRGWSSQAWMSWIFCERMASLISSLASMVERRQKAISLIKRMGDHFSFAYSKWTSRFPDPQSYLTWSAPQISTMSPMLDEDVELEAPVSSEPSRSSRDLPMSSSDLLGRTPLELPVRKGPSGVELPVSSKSLSELGLSETAQRDFEALRQSILEQKPLVKNVQHITQSNGRERFLITFDRAFCEFRFLKETHSVTISCCGTGGRTIYGHDAAAHITHILYTASLGQKEAGNFGAGI